MPAKKSSKKRLFLIDGYSNIFRAFYAIRGLSNSKGEPTNAVYGFINMLRKLLREEQPDLIGIAMDTGGRTFRKEKYEEYKANRSPMPDDLKSQMPAIRRAIEAFRIPMLELATFEADDVLGTISKKAVEDGFEVVLVTADKDFFQIVSNDIKLLHSFREKLYDPKLVEEDFGVPPEQVIDVLALMGDSVDNIPGVPGIGEKGAKNLVKDYGSLENLLEKAAELKRKNYREGLQNHRDQALLSKELVTIQCDLDIDFDAEALKYEEPDNDALLELYREFDFFTLIKELEEMGVGSKEQQILPAVDCEDTDQWREKVRDLGPTITIGAVLGNEAIGVSVATGEEVESEDGGTAVATLFADFRREGLREAVVETLRSWVSDETVSLLGHDLKEVLRICGRDVETRCKLIDTMLMSYLVRTSVRNFSLEDVSLELLYHKVVSAKEAGFNKGEPPQQLETAFFVYAAEQAALPLALSDLLSPRLEDGSVERGGDDPGDPAKVYHQIEEPLVPVLMRMEEAGIELDVPFLEEMSGRLAKLLEELEREIYEIADEEFNILSPMQLGKIMFEKLDYPIMKRTRKTKKYSTNAETLEALAAEGYELPERVLRFREISKLKSTYVDALPELVDDSARLHTRFNQAVAATGRLSSANPNLQNIPVRTEIGLEIRKAFRARDGQLLLVADYSQIELRVLAHIAEEPELIRAFSEGADIHRSTAASVFEVEPDFVNDEQRRAAKVINFGIIYGMSPFGLAQNLGISNAEAKKFIEAYFERFPEVKRYTDETLERASEELCVTTLYGRTRWLPDIRSRNYPMRENAKRMAINARIQGTAADLMKIAMIEVDERLRSDFPDARLLLTVHDELVLEVPEGGIEAAQAMVIEEMQGAADLKVPLEVDVGVGKTWFDAKHG